MSRTAVATDRERIVAVLSTSWEKVDRLRIAITAADTERKAVMDLPRSPAEIEEAADTIVRQLSLMGENMIPNRRLFRRDTPLDAGTIVAAASEFPIAFAVALAPEKFHALLVAGMPSNGVTLRERQKLLDEIDDRRLCLLAAEELALRDLDKATGNHVERRRDIDDEDLSILVAPSSELRPFAEKADVASK